MKFEAPRGTQDVLPAEWAAWRHVLDTAEGLFARYGYRRVQTPVFEDTELFARTSGEGSDVVQKEMYSFTDRGDRSLTLRPEGTAPICRAYLQHGLHREPQPVKLYAVASMYRYAAPQRGRFREHWQFSVEAIGSADPAVDAELVQLYDALLRVLGIGDLRLQLNSIGDANCRPAYVARLEEWLDAHDGSLDDDAVEKRATSPLRVFDVKRRCAPLAGAPTIGESLCDACRSTSTLPAARSTRWGCVRARSDTREGARLLHAHDLEFAPASCRLAVRRRGRYDGLIQELRRPRRRPASDSAPASSGSCSPSRGGAPRRRGWTSSRRRGWRSPHDGHRLARRAAPPRGRLRHRLRGPLRSRGQLTQAGAAARRRRSSSPGRGDHPPDGAADEAISHDALLARLSP